MSYEPLSALDAAFVYLERNGPMNVGSLGVFEGRSLLDARGRLPVADLRRHLAERVAVLPRFRRQLAAVPFGFGHPVWVEGADVDPADHIRVVRVAPPGGAAELFELMARIQAEPLDRDRPLWELWVIDGLAHNRFAIIQKIHHAFSDGISAVDAARVLFDRQPGPPDVGESPPPAVDQLPTLAPTPAGLLAGSVARSAAGAIGGLRAVPGAVRTPAVTAAGAARLARNAWSALRPVSRCSFNVAAGRRRAYEGFSVDLADVYAAKRALGCTANDLVLAAVAGGLRGWLAARGESATRPVRAMVPVSVRRRRERMTFGNRISAMFAELPVHLADPAERVRAVHAETARLARGGQAEDLDRLLAAAGQVPAPLYAAVASRLASWPPRANLVVTNVPGPSAPLHCLGAPLAEAYPWIAPVDGMALGVAVVRYNRRLFFGISAGADAVPDLGLLADAMEKAAGELVERT